MKAMIAVVDDDQGLRDSLILLLQSAEYSVEPFESVEALLDRAATVAPACIVLDHTLPATKGVDAIGVLRETFAGASIIVLTAYGTVPLAVHAVREGAFEFLEKPFDPVALLDIVSRAVSATRLETGRATAEREARQRLTLLTDRESEVLQHMLDGAPNKAIAVRLQISPRTVEIHRSRVIEKLGCRGPVELYRRYRDLVPALDG